MGFSPTPIIERMKVKDKLGWGFTLIEMLIVLAMFSLIGLAIFTTLSNGVRIWQRLNQTIAQEDVNIFFERFARELRNTFEFDTIKFQGQADKVVFASLVTTPGSSQGQRQRQEHEMEMGIGQLTYSYDKTTGQLIREKRDYSQIYTGDDGSQRELLKDIDSLKFIYYLYDEKKKDYVWQEEYLSEGLPLALRIELEFNDEQKSKSIIRTIEIPVTPS